MIPAWHQLVPISGHVEESETARKLQLYATSIKTSVSTRLRDDGSSDTDVNKFFSQQIMVDHIERFREVCENHRPHIVEFISTLMQKME